MKHRQKIVALFILGAVVFVFFILGMILVRNKTFKSKLHYHTLLDTAKGLSGYPTIYFKGYSIGKVSKFRLTHELKIRVDFYIFKEYQDLIFEHSLLAKNENILSGEITDFKLVLPNKDYRKKTKSQKTIIFERSSEEGQALIAQGISSLESGGIAGIVNKVNVVLNQFVEQKTPEKLNSMVHESNELLIEIKRTVSSYNAEKSPEAKQALVNIVKQASQSIQSINKTLLYFREILKVVHRNKDEFTPILMKTNRTLDQAGDTFEGINNNPLIRGGIRKKKKEIQLETLD